MEEEMPKTIEEILKLKLPKRRNDPIRNQRIPIFMMRTAIIPKIYKETQAITSPSSKPLDHPTKRHCLEEKTPKISYYKIRQKLQTPKKSSGYYDEAAHRQELFTNGYTLLEKQAFLPSSFPNRFAELPSTEEKKPAVVLKQTKYKRHSLSYQPKSSYGRVSTLLLKQEKSIDLEKSLNKESRTHERNICSRGAVCREKIKQEIKQFTYHRRNSTESHRKNCMSNKNN